MTGTSAMPADEGNKPGDDFLGLLDEPTNLGDSYLCNLAAEYFRGEDDRRAIALAKESLVGDEEDSGDKNLGSEEGTTIPGDEKDSSDKKLGLEEEKTIHGAKEDSGDKNSSSEEEKNNPRIE